MRFRTDIKLLDIIAKLYGEDALPDTLPFNHSHIHRHSTT